MEKSGNGEKGEKSDPSDLSTMFSSLFTEFTNKTKNIKDPGEMISALLNEDTLKKMSLMGESLAKMLRPEEKKVEKKVEKVEAKEENEAEEEAEEEVENEAEAEVKEEEAEEEPMLEAKMSLEMEKEGEGEGKDYPEKVKITCGWCEKNNTEYPDLSFEVLSCDYCDRVACDGCKDVSDIHVAGGHVYCMDCETHLSAESEQID